MYSDVKLVACREAPGAGKRIHARVKGHLRWTAERGHDVYLA